MAFPSSLARPKADPAVAENAPADIVMLAKQRHSNDRPGFPPSIPTEETQRRKGAEQKTLVPASSSTPTPRGGSSTPESSFFYRGPIAEPPRVVISSLVCCKSCSRSPLAPITHLLEERRQEKQEGGCAGLAWWREVGMGEDGVWRERKIDGQDAGNVFIHLRFWS
jgi:hypothetical protein